MTFARSTAAKLPSAARFARSGTRASPARQLQRVTQQSGRRGYSSGKQDDHVHQAGSDIPWLIGAVAVTVPGTWYLLPSKELVDSYYSKDDGHGHGHGEESKEESKEEPEEPKEEPKEEAKEEPKEEAKEEPAESKEESTKEAKSAAEKEVDDSAGNVHSGGSEEDAKGMKKTVQEESKRKEARQRNLDNTETYHPFEPSENPSYSKKAEGVAETTKISGVVDPTRPLDYDSKKDPLKGKSGQPGKE